MSFVFHLNDKSEYISFNSKSKNQSDQFLSNFIGGPVRLTYQTGETLTYQTGEHAFQSAKFYLTNHFEYARTFVGSQYLTALDAKRAGKTFRLDSNELNYWNLCVKDIQYYICIEKLKNIQGLKEYLISTKKYLLHLEAFGSWSIYGGVFLEKSPFNDGKLWLKGNNLLGKVWMEIRDSI